MKDPQLPAPFLRMARTFWVGAMLYRLGMSSIIVTPKTSASSSGDMAKVKRPHIVEPAIP